VDSQAERGGFYLSCCGRAGLHVVEVGELEGFDKTAGSHGPKWVNEVLEKPLLTDPELADARAFVARLTGLPDF
jgi:hypothetical protein